MSSLKSLVAVSCLSVFLGVSVSQTALASTTGQTASILSKMSAQEKSKRSSELKKFMEETAKIRRTQMNKQYLTNLDNSKKMNELILKQQEEMDKLIYESLTSENFDQNKMQIRQQQLELEVTKMQKEFEAKNKKDNDDFLKTMNDRNTEMNKKWSLFPQPGN